jgi:DNA segregation ATPase FtsK/SpoIIIE-like protein
MTVEQTHPLYEEQPQYQFQTAQSKNVHAGYGQTGAFAADSAASHSLFFNVQSQLNSSLHRFRGAADGFMKTLGVEGIRVLNEDGNFQLQLVRPFEPAVPLLDLLRLLPGLPPITAVLGLAENGTPMTHTFTAEHKPNMLICGQADAGKTFLLRAIVASLAISSKQAEVQMLAINPVSSDRERHEAQEAALRPLSFIPHMLADVAMRQTEITEMVFFLVREMEYRLEHRFTSPRIILLVDQAATVLERGGRTMVESFQSLAQKGPDVGINLVLSTRRPEAAVFDPLLTANLQARFTGRLNLAKATEEEAAASDVEATTLLGEGDFLAAGSSSRSVRFQAAYINDYDLQLRLTRIYRKRPILLAQPLDRREKPKLQSPQSLQFEPQLPYVDGMVLVN